MWGADGKDLLIGQLRAELAQRNAIIAQRDATLAQRDATLQLLQAQLALRDEKLAAAQARIAELQAQLLRHFQVPPKSSEPELPEKKPPRRRRRKRGAQPGHPGHVRKLLPPERVSEVVALVPAVCAHCGQPLLGTDPTPCIHQVVEVPPLFPKVTEYRRHQLLCPGCGHKTRAELPQGVPKSAFGPRLCALVAILTGKYHLSKRMVEELLCDFLGTKLSLGSVSQIEKTVSQALWASVAEAMQTVKSAPVVYQDETSWRQQHGKAWLWVAVTAVVTVFMIAWHRSKKVCQQLLGQQYQGTLVSDRFSAYLWVPDTKRQLCWSHLQRDFEELVEAGGDGARLGRALLAQTRRLFRYWHRIRDQTLPFSELEKKMAPVRRQVHRLLVDGVRYYTGKAKKLSQQLLLHEEAMWHFVKVPGVEPTNNRAERAQRQAVLWRRGSFGTQSEAGSLFVSRILTVIATLRQQGRNVLEYVTAACQAQLLHHPAPSLLPASL